jgi:uncharacterized membrane protein YjfL (UPF0719 family)
MPQSIPHAFWKGKTVMPPEEFFQSLWQGFIGTVVYGLLGILLTVLGFKVFDLITPRMDIEKELAEKNNLAVAIVVAAIILGVSAIAVVAIR